jgi:hypothetical protein
MLSVNRSNEAEKTPAEATELYQNLSDTDPVLKSTVEQEAPVMPAIYRNASQNL